MKQNLIPNILILFQNVRRWSQLLMMKNGQKTFREKHNQSISSGIQSGEYESSGTQDIV